MLTKIAIPILTAALGVLPWNAAGQVQRPDARRDVLVAAAAHVRVMLAEETQFFPDPEAKRRGALLVDPTIMEPAALRAVLAAVGNATPMPMEEVDASCRWGNREGCSVNPLPEGLATFDRVRLFQSDSAVVDLGLYVFPPPEKNWSLIYRQDRVTLQLRNSQWIVVRAIKIGVS